jgi:hypothetical protein
MERPEREGDDHPRVSDEEAEELEEDAAERNPDRQTRREALELELIEEGRSEEGEDVGDEID